MMLKLVAAMALLTPSLSWVPPGVTINEYKPKEEVSLPFDNDLKMTSTPKVFVFEGTHIRLSSLCNMQTSATSFTIILTLF